MEQPTAYSINCLIHIRKYLSLFFLFVLGAFTQVAIVQPVVQSCMYTIYIWKEKVHNPISYSTSISQILTHADSC